MAYDGKLAHRIRRVLHDQSNVTEKEMFGGIAFMIKGNVACGIIGDDLMVRVGPENYDAALKESHVRPFDMTGKPFAGWVMVGTPALASSASLGKWIKRGVEFASTLRRK